MKQIEAQPYYYADEPQVIAELGLGKLEVVINVGTHGNEIQPFFAVEMFLSDFDPSELVGTLRFTLANPPALRAGKRFLVTDLNRGYPGNLNGQGEERLAAQMLPLVQAADAVVDLHTAPMSPAMVILGARNPNRLRLAEMAGIEPIVLFESKIPVAMVDFTKCGIGIELGAHADPESARRGVDVIRRYLIGLGLLPGALPAHHHQYYQVFGSLSREDAQRFRVDTALRDFESVEGDAIGLPESGVVYPLLVDQHRVYAPFHCILARNIERSDIVQEDI